MDVVAAVCTDEETAAVVEPGEGALDDPALAAHPGAVSALAASDYRFHAELPDEPAVLVVVVPAVGEQGVGSAARAAGTSANRRNAVEQFE